MAPLEAAESPVTNGPTAPELEDAAAERAAVEGSVPEAGVPPLQSSSRTKVLVGSSALDSHVESQATSIGFLERESSGTPDGESARLWHGQPLR